MVDLVMTQTHMHFTYIADERMADQLTYSSPGKVTSRVLLTNMLSRAPGVAQWPHVHGWLTH